MWAISSQVHIMERFRDYLAREYSDLKSQETPHIPLINMEDDDIVHAKRNFGTNVSDWS